jgi:hypothetical protein
MRTQIDQLREQLAGHLRAGCRDDPRVEHLRWQLLSLERQQRWRDDAAGLFGPAPARAAAPLPDRARRA